MKNFNFKAVILVLSVAMFGAMNANANTSVYTYNQPNVGNGTSFNGSQSAGNHFGINDDRAQFASRSGFSRRSFGESKHWHSGPVVAPVPEAKTYSMMLAGLGLMCLIVYRRRMYSN